VRLLNVGGASAILEHRGKRLLFDPWITDGIFHGAWYHFPPCRMGIGDLGHLDYVYVSHIHEDHCAPSTMRHLNRDAEMVLLDRTPNYVLSFLRQHNLDFGKVHLVRTQTPTDIGSGIRVDMLPGDPAHELSHLVDSIIVLQWDGATIVNANDCQLYPAAIDYLRSTYPRIDLALLPYSGGSGYPGCYVNLSNDEKMRERTRIVDMRTRAFVEVVEALQPEYAMPFADQYVVAGSRAHLNRYVAHEPSPSLLSERMRSAGLERRLLLLNSGQSFDIESGTKAPDETYCFFTEAQREDYVANRLADKKYDHEQIALDPRVSIERLVQAARRRLWAEQQKRGSFPRRSLYLDVPDRNARYCIRLDAPDVEVLDLDSHLTEPFLRVVAVSSLMAFLLIGHVSWNIADAALFLDYERRPNVYDPSDYVLLNLLKV
jgi:UDP-MurNAc hydroxylase